MNNGKSLSAILFAPCEISPAIYQQILTLLFFASGVAALIYQITWQRMLFTLFGVDLHSTTIIVAVFMFGLGIGGALGGYIADWLRTRLLTFYVIIELLIAAFGFLSPQIILYANDLIFISQISLVCASFIILCFPTILMGMTFPILVTYLNQTQQHVGRSVGELYFANTLGGAVGAYFTGFVLFYPLHVTQVIYHAATLNIAIALIAAMIFRKSSS